MTETAAVADIHNDVALQLPKPQAAESHGEPGVGRNQAFDAEMQEYSAKNYRILTEKTSVGDYLKKSHEEEEEEYKKLLKWREDKTLNENQRKEVDALIKNHDYNAETRALREAYDANPNDPEAKAKYEKRQAELTEFRGLIENDEVFGKNQHMVKAKELEEKLAAAKTDDEKKSVKMEIADEFRSFMRDVNHDGASADKFRDDFVRFVDKNKDHVVIQSAGLVEMAHVVREKQAMNFYGQRHEETKAPEAAHELQHAEVKPAGVPVAGAVVTYKDSAGQFTIEKNEKGELIAKDKDEHVAAAKTEIAVTVDDGKGGTQTQKYVVSEQGTLLPAPPSTPAVSNDQAAAQNR